jgi:hypothetical protein
VKLSEVFGRPSALLVYIQYLARIIEVTSPLQNRKALDVEERTRYPCGGSEHFTLQPVLANGRDDTFRTAFGIYANYKSFFFASASARSRRRFRQALISLSKPITSGTPTGPSSGR